MQKLHKKLTERHQWYAKWHQHPHHGLVHVLILLLFIGVFASQVLDTQAINQNASDTALYNPHNRSGGYIPDDPEKVKKVSRLVVTKDKSKIKVPEGESIIAMAPLETLPTVVSLDTPPVTDQGAEGSCVAQSGSNLRAIEQYYKTNKTPYNQATNIFSPEYLYNQTKFTADCATGTSMQIVLDAIKNQGVSTWQSMPYSSTNGCDLMPNAEQIAEASGFKINGYLKIANTDQIAIKTMVSTNHPVMVAVLADNSFINAGPGFIWKIKTGGMLAHAVTIVGYDDSKNAYKVMNSWGTSWGDAGFSYIDYDFFPTIAAGSGWSYVISDLPYTTDFTPPNISLTSPINGATLSGTTTFSASAFDNIAVAGVRFRVDGVTIGTEDTTVPYSLTLNTSSFSSGTHTVTAIARDTSGHLASSDSVTINVVSGTDTTAPTVSMTSPTSGATLSGVTTLSASASDNVGVDHVDFYSGTKVIGADASAPYSINWDTATVSNGTYSLSARAYDAAGNSATSSAVSVSINNVVVPPPDTTAPTVSMKSPLDGSTVSGSTTLSASASDNVGVTKVSFFRGSTLIDTDTTASPDYAITWDTTALSNGSYTISAKAYDVAGNIGTSSSINIIVDNGTPQPPATDTTPPVVTVTSPENGSTISGSVTISASATDNLGSVPIMEIYVDGGLIRSQTSLKTTISYKWNIRKVSSGAHTITVKAYDSAGNIGQASVIIYK